jgi:NAD(P)-dependent dehydrogenase (short-subunit alcohol dehydrogenase family)
MTVLRERLLRDRAVALAGGPPMPVRERLVDLGARVEELPGGLDEDDARNWASGAGPLDALVYDAAPAFGAGGPDALRDALDRAWIATRAVATGAMIRTPPARTPNKVVLIGPAPSGDFAPAAGAALENLARTLSVEWARYGITAVAVIRGGARSDHDQDLAELVCFLVSPAGDYFSGCRLELAGPDAQA